LNRKDEHLSLAKAFHKERTNDFDHVRLLHPALVHHDLATVSLATKMAGQTLTAPFFINAITGGSNKTAQVNRELAIVARKTGLAMASGSVTAALNDPSVAASFSIIRNEHPDGFLLANIGAHVPLEQARQAIELFHADALQIHLNVPQELVMPEGDRAFRHWAENIKTVIAGVTVPVIVKEVGFGMTRETIHELTTLGAKTIDVSGAGGTSFTQIENARRKHREFDYLATYGQSTVESLLEANEVHLRPEIIASGGIRNAYDIFKALALGASAVGISGTLLNTLLTSGVDKTVALVESYQQQLANLYVMHDCATTADVQQLDVLLEGSLQTFCANRRIDPTSYSFRTD
jgi:isopentenyl-diphosphate delta-isomerase